MSKDMLSQEDIDAMLNGGSKSENDPIQLDSVKVDIIGEVGNISMSTAATTLSTILNHKVNITTPKVKTMPLRQIINESTTPKVVTSIGFIEGLEGRNLLMMDIKDAAIIADLMMGGDGHTDKDEFTELELSAVGEAMNQMIGSASTSMATMLNMNIDIEPPKVDVWDNEEEIELYNMDLDENICQVAFDLTVEGLIESEIMQVFTHDMIDKITDVMMGDLNSGSKPVEKTKVVEPVAAPVVEEKPSEVTVEVQKPVFTELNAGNEKMTVPRNLDLIMDVPLEFNVVLGRSKKTIKEILSFSSGSIVELDKLADEPLEIYVNGKLIAEGEVVVINENFGVRIMNILTKEERLSNLK